MHRIVAALAALLMLTATASASAKLEFLSRDAVAAWMDTYRAKPEPARLPAAIHLLSEARTFKDPDTTGYYVGFIAGVLGANPKTAERLIGETLPLPASDQWMLVRAIAYSGLPEWKALLRKFSPRLPDRQAMIEAYLADKLPTLDTAEFEKPLTWVEKLKVGFGHKMKKPEMSFGQNPELLDTLWGQYFATGQYRSVWRIVSMLPWSKDRDSIEKLTIGSMAKVTLATNAARYPDVLALIQEIGPSEPKDTATIVAEVVHAAETSQAGKLKQEALAQIDEIKRKGPGVKRDVATWSLVGQGAIGIGCVIAAASSLTTFGLPCVIGGAATSAVLNYWGATTQ